MRSLANKSMLETLANPTSNTMDQSIEAINNATMSTREMNPCEAEDEVGEVDDDDAGEEVPDTVVIFTFMP